MPSATNTTTVKNGEMRDSLSIAQEIGREMKLEAADALLAVSSEPREGKSALLEEIDGEDKVVRSRCSDEPTKKIVKIEPVNGGVVKSPMAKEGNMRAPTHPESTISPNHKNPQGSALSLKSTQRSSRTPTTDFFRYPDQMHSMDQRHFSHAGIAAHQYPPYGASYPFPYTPHPWNSEVRFHLDQHRSRNRCTQKIQPFAPRAWR